MLELDTVLVVDDDANMPRHIRSMLGSVKVIGTTDPFTTLDLVRRMRPQLALIDHYMPLRNGLEVIAEVRRSFPSLAIGYMSGLITIELSMEAIRAGVTWFIEKPFDKDQLVDNVTKGGRPLVMSEPPLDGDYNLDRAYNKHIWSVLAIAEGNKSKAAQMLGIRRTSLQAILSRIGSRDSSDQEPEDRRD